MKRKIFIQIDQMENADIFLFKKAKYRFNAIKHNFK